LTTVAEFTVKKGERVPFVLTWFASHSEPPKKVTPDHAFRDTERYWKKWAKRCHRKTPWHDAVVRSLIVLKGLTYAPTGGIVAAATTSLPEEIGGVRNWDYRYCWLRDATLTLIALVSAGYQDEAKSWREWLLRAIAGSADQMQSCTACAENAVRKSSSFPGYRVTKIQSPFALATVPPVSFSSMFMAKYWARCIARTRPESKTAKPIGACKSP